MSTSAKVQVPLVRFGFGAGRSVLQPRASMRNFVRRDEIALHLVERGSIRVLFAAGGILMLPPGRLMASWGAFPHRAEWLERNTILYSVTLPLGWVLEWDLPRTLLQPLLNGRFLLGPDGAAGQRDLQRMQQWTSELPRADAALTQVVLLEVRARLLRMGLTDGAEAGTRSDGPFPAHASLERVLRFMAAHLTEPLHVREIAVAAGLHPAYVSQMFKRNLGIGPAAYLAQCRIAHAQALLLSTNRTVADIAERSGFGSTCQFHTIFRRQCGCTPGRYRRTHARSRTIAPG